MAAPEVVRVDRFTNFGEELVLRGNVADENIARFSLSFFLNEEEKYSYVFYVTPEQIQITVPSRMAVYQTIGGNTYVDHLGEGVTSISLTGTTGYRLGAKYSIGFGYAAYHMLRYIVNQYHDACRQGLTSQARLTLHISFPDAADFGAWDVTIQELILSRNASQPLLFRYVLNLVCLGPDKLAKDRPFIDLSKLKSQVIGVDIALPVTVETEQEVPPEAEAVADELFGMDYILYAVPAEANVTEDTPNTLNGIASRLMVNGVARLSSALESRDYNEVATINSEIAAAVSAIMDANPEMFVHTRRYQPLEAGMVLIIPQSSSGVIGR